MRSRFRRRRLVAKSAYELRDVCPSVLMYRMGSYSKNFSEICYWRLYENRSRRNVVKERPKCRAHYMMLINCTLKFLSRRKCIYSTYIIHLYNTICRIITVETYSAENALNPKYTKPSSSTLFIKLGSSEDPTVFCNFSTV